MCFCLQFFFVLRLGLVTSTDLAAATLALKNIFCLIAQIVNLVYTLEGVLHRQVKHIWQGIPSQKLML